MLDRFELSEKYQVFRVIRPIPKAAISRSLRLSSEGKTGHAIDQAIRETIKTGVKKFLTSYVVFRVEHPPTFLSKGKERDIKHCYALIFEHGDYLVITRYGGKNFLECIEDYVEKVSSDVINAAFMETASTVKKASAQTTTLSKSNVQRITYEGDNLEANMPVQGVSNRMLNTFKHETQGELFTITGSQAKFNISNSKVSINQYLARVLIAVEKFGKKQKTNPFLTNFAKSLSFKQYVNKITPIEILLLSTQLRDQVESRAGNLPQIIYKIGRAEKLLKLTFNEFLNSIKNSFELLKVGAGSNRQFYIENKFDKKLELAITDTGYELSSPKYSRIYLRYADGETENLQKLINRKNFFTLSFNNAEINFAKGQLWQDSKLLGNIDGFLQMFVPESEMNHIVSEKGLIVATSTNFQAGSTFEFVERTFSPKLDHLILEDLQYEFADYIGVKKMSKVQSIHCKTSDKVFSASAFQDIVGQVLKNLYFFTHPEQVDTRKAFWSGSYTGSNIARNRTGKKSFMADLKVTMSAINSDKEVYLVVNFISKKLLTDNLNKVKRKEKAPQATLPLLWLLNSLRNSCLERNVKVYIICKP